MSCINIGIPNEFVCLSRTGKTGKLPPVPPIFVNLVQISLYKLVGVNLIPKELVGADFFAKMRVKFQNASKKVDYPTDPLTIFVYNLKNNFFLLFQWIELFAIFFIVLYFTQILLMNCCVFTELTLCGCTSNSRRHRFDCTETYEPEV